MAARPTWRGHMKISLVTVPAQVFAATNSTAKIQFNLLHRSATAASSRRSGARRATPK